MKEIISCIERLRLRLERHRKEDLKESSTRLIFVNPMLQALGWDVEEPDEVKIEYSTIDGKSVDYAPQIDGKPVLFVEAKALNDPLSDVRDIAQVVSYAAIAGVEWCVLTNGITYKVYRSTEKAEAREKWLFSVSIDPRDSEGIPLQKIAEQFARLSREAMARRVLGDWGEQVFTSRKVRKAVEDLFLDPPYALIRLVRGKIRDDSIKPEQVKTALKTMRPQTTEAEVPATHEVIPPPKPPTKAKQRKIKEKDYGEGHHIDGKPREALELYHAIDAFCMGLSPGNVQRRYLAKYVGYSQGNSIFCCVHILKSGLRVWLKLNYSDIEKAPEYVRDVSKIGHWGVGNVEVGIDSLDKAEVAKSYIKQSFAKVE